MEVVFFLVLIVYAIASGFFTKTVATAKGYSADNWFFAGLFFGLLALIAICGMPMKQDCCKANLEPQPEEHTENKPQKLNGDYLLKPISPVERVVWAALAIFVAVCIILTIFSGK